MRSWLSRSCFWPAEGAAGKSIITSAVDAMPARRLYTPHRSPFPHHHPDQPVRIPPLFPPSHQAPGQSILTSLYLPPLPPSTATSQPTPPPAPPPTQRAATPHSRWQSPLFFATLPVSFPHLGPASSRPATRTRPLFAPILSISRLHVPRPRPASWSHHRRSVATPSIRCKRPASALLCTSGPAPRTRALPCLFLPSWSHPKLQPSRNNGVLWCGAHNMASPPPTIPLPARRRIVLRSTDPSPAPHPSSAPQRVPFSKCAA